MAALGLGGSLTLPTACSTATAASSSAGPRPTCSCSGPATTSSSSARGADGLSFGRQRQEPRPVPALGPWSTVGLVAVPASDVLPGAARRARALARTLGAAEAVGVMAACTDTAVAYAKERVQFGRTIGTFQAVKHHCADMLVAAELATAAVWDAARAVGRTAADEFELVAAMAAHLAFAPAVHNAQMNIQVHGGIGFTWEHDAHLFLRRALVLERRAGLARRRRGRDCAWRPRARPARSSLDLPPEAEAIRAERACRGASGSATLSGAEQRKALVEPG